MNSGSIRQVTTLPAVSWTTPPPPMTDRFRWFCSQACTKPRLTRASVAVRSGGWGEELGRDPVRAAEAHARPVTGVLDRTVGDSQLVEAVGPLLQLGPTQGLLGPGSRADLVDDIERRLGGAAEAAEPAGGYLASPARRPGRPTPGGRLGRGQAKGEPPCSSEPSR